MDSEDQITPLTILAEIVRHTRAQSGHAQSLSSFSPVSFSHLQRDSDLCPAFHDKAKRILTSFEKYRPITYDVEQEPDAEITMRYSSPTVSYGKEGKERYIGMGVVSFDEFEKDDDLVSKIKARIQRAGRDYGTKLDRYFLLLCTDDRKHEGQIQAIREALAADAAVAVVEPADAWFFYAMEETMIDAVSDQLLYSNDYVRQQAREQITDIGKRKLILLLSCLVHAIEEMKNFSVADEFVIHNDHLRDFEASHPGDYVPSLEEVAAMEGRFFFRDADVEGLRIYQDSVSAVIALYYDAKVRYGHEADEAVQYLFTLLEASA
jgi:hypothetical protein